MPVVCSRKWPGVAISSGALPENPNCQMDPGTGQRREQEQEIDGNPLLSASREKWMPIIGDSAIDRPQLR